MPFKKGSKGYWLGKKRPPFSEEYRKKMSLSKFKNKNPMWQGGIAKLPYTNDWTETLKKSIRQRDCYTCQICGKEPSVHIHHIDYNKKNCSSENLITLCKSCHPKTNGNREYWKEWFKNKKLYG